MRYIGVLIALLPSTAMAAVTINEVAWMGDAASANHEWIELHNSSNTNVDVTGWKLTDGMNLSIDLEGSIAAGGYAVLERSSDESAAGAAFFIYTGALVNTGATLTLRRFDGGIEDQISGGENWEQIGGDNITKETAQYTTGGWITAAATPGTNNATQSTPKNTTTKTSGPLAVPVKSRTESPTILSLPPISLGLAIAAPQQVFKHQTIDFSVVPTGVGDAIANSLIYSWNFGDGQTAKGQKPSHHYDFAGTYLITVHGQYKRQEYVARQEITVLPVTLSITRNTNGDIQIHNDAPYEIDVSNYRISGNSEFIFAPHSFILSRQTITLNGAAVGGLATVYDALGNIVISEDTFNRNSLLPRLQTALAPVVASNSSVQNKEPEKTANEAQPTSTTIIQLGVTDEEKETPIKPANNNESSRWPYIGLAGLIGLAWFGLIYHK